MYIPRYKGKKVGHEEKEDFRVYSTYGANFGRQRKAGRKMRKRNHVIPIRLNAKELHHLDEQVTKSGFSREEYLRSLICGADVRAKPCEHHADLLRKIAGLCNNANQLAHVANASGMADQESVREMLRISKETWQIVKEDW